MNLPVLIGVVIGSLSYAAFAGWNTTRFIVCSAAGYCFGYLLFGRRSI